MTRDEDAAAWGKARTLAELAELTARWIKGKLSYIPTSGAAGPDPETTSIAEPLVAFNRAGFLTDFSQPGVAPEPLGAQRAAVLGFSSEATAQTLAFACLTTDLICLVSEPGSSEGPWVPVTIDDGLAFTWIPPPTSPEALVESWKHDLSRDGLLALVNAWQVALVDPVWGRNDLLCRRSRQLSLALP